MLSESRVQRLRDPSMIGAEGSFGVRTVNESLISCLR